MKSKNILFLLINIIFVLLVIISSCGKKNKRYKFDLSPFEARGWINEKNLKYLTYIRLVHGQPNDFFFFCNMEKDKLEKYKLSGKLDIIYLIKVDNKKDTVLLNKLINDERWCYENYIVTFDKIDFFGANVGVAYLLDTEGYVIEMTNPSLPSFKKIIGF